MIPIKSDASFRKFYRKKINKKSSIIVYAKKEKIKNLLNYDTINKLLLKNKIFTPKLLSENFSAPIDQLHLYFLLWDTAHDFECLCQPDISVLLVLIKCHSANMRSDRSQFTSTLCPFTHNTYCIEQDRDSYQCSERGRLLNSELPMQPPDDETTQTGDNRAER